MGFFSGLGKAIGNVVGAISDPISSLVGLGSNIMGVAAPFMEQQSVSDANRMNQQLAREQMEFQTLSNSRAMDFASTQAANARHFNATEAGVLRGFTADEARKARDFTRDMSNTSYQRAVKDLAAAGLNPMLAYTQGGASTPGASPASASAASSSSPSGVTSAGALARMEPTFRAQSVSSAAQSRVLGAQVANMNADTANKLLTAGNISADTNLKGSQSYQATSQGHVNQQMEKKIIQTVGPLLDQIKASAAQSSASADHLRSQNLLMKDLMENPVTRPFAPLLNLIFK